MATSDLDIVNEALLLVADETIASLDENTKAAKLSKIKWPQIRDSVLALADWNCARARASLVRLAAAPAFGYDYQYALPTEPWYLVGRYIQLDDGEYKAMEDNRFGGETSSDESFSVEGRVILTNAETVNLVFTSRATNPIVYSPYVIDVFAAKLASEICSNITGSESKTQYLEQLYRDRLKTAKSINAREGKPILKTATMLSVRG